MALSLLVAAAALVVSVAAGTVAHELSHAAVLRASAIPCDVEWFPDDGERGLAGAVLTGRLAVVTPRSLPDGVAAWRLRLAAMTPFALALPFVVVLAGVVPDSAATGTLPVQMAALGWLACALPSPQDFSVLFYADRALGEEMAGAASEA